MAADMREKSLGDDKSKREFIAAAGLDDTRSSIAVVFNGLSHPEKGLLCPSASGHCASFHNNGLGS